MATSRKSGSLRDTLKQAGIEDPNGTIKRWHAARTDNVLAAARIINELKPVLRSLQQDEPSQQPQATSATGDSREDIAAIKNLLVNSEYRTSATTARIELWRDEIRASLEKSTEVSQRVGDLLKTLGERTDTHTQALDDKTKSLQRVTGIAIGLVAASVFVALTWIVLSPLGSS